VAATDYGESITSLLYPGNTLSQDVLQDAIQALEHVLHIDPKKRSRICLRLDAGFGTDTNLAWMLPLGYQTVTKSHSGRRAGAWGRLVTDWQELEAGHRWVAVPPKQLQFGVPTRTVIVRWRDHRRGTFKHALYVTTDLQCTPAELCHTYDLRGGAEVDIRDDKQGLLLTHRCKRRWPAQEMLLLLNDLAHNFLSAFRHHVLAGTPLADFGPTRLIRDVFSIHGEAIIADDDRLLELHLAGSHPYAPILVEVLPRLWQ
jgi:hypothetical protein